MRQPRELNWNNRIDRFLISIDKGLPASIRVSQDPEFLRKVSDLVDGDVVGSSFIYDTGVRLEGSDSNASIEVVLYTINTIKDDIKKCLKAIFDDGGRKVSASEARENSYHAGGQGFGGHTNPSEITMEPIE